MPEPPLQEPGPELDLSSYAGCWVAMVRGQVVAVGRTAEAAQRAARQARPREEPLVIYVRHAPPVPD